MITYNEDGTLVIEKLGITLQPPDIGDLWHLEDKIVSMVRDYQDQATKLQAELDQYESDEEVPDELDQQARKFKREAFISMFADWYIEVVDRLGDKPLPERVEDWPADFLDLTLPYRIKNHWQHNPKASGANQQ